MTTTRLKQCAQGHENPVSARFCDECGEPFDASTVEESPEEVRRAPIPVPSSRLLFDDEGVGVTDRGEVLVLLGPSFRLVFFPSLSADQPSSFPELGAVTGLEGVVWEYYYEVGGWRGSNWLRPGDYREAPVVARDIGAAGAPALGRFADDWAEAQRMVAELAEVGCFPAPFGSFCEQVVRAEAWFLERLRLENIAVAVR
jgi:hypothetical protein